MPEHLLSTDRALFISFGSHEYLSLFNIYSKVIANHSTPVTGKTWSFSSMIGGTGVSSSSVMSKRTS